ncbi:MAG: hypothetical protein ACRC5M_06900 [Anaeroplasmataceae bacterium]
MNKNNPKVKFGDFVKIGSNTFNFDLLTNKMDRWGDSYECYRLEAFAAFCAGSKASKTFILDTVMEYKDIVKENQGSIIYNSLAGDICSILMATTSKELLKNNMNALTSSIKKYIESDKEMINVKLRSHFTRYFHLSNISIIFSEDTTNMIDFYFDSLKAYDVPSIGGIVVKHSPTGIDFSNSDDITMTVVINIGRFVNYITDTTLSLDDNMDNFVKTIPGDAVNAIGNTIEVCFWAALIRDNSRIVNTNMSMIYLSFLTQIDYSFVNTKTGSDKCVNIQSSDERTLLAFNEFQNLFSGPISDMMRSKHSPRDMHRFTKMISYVSISNIISLFEKSDSTINEILKILMIKKSDKDFKFASTKKLLEIKADCECEKAMSVAKDLIITGRYFPLVFLKTFCSECSPKMVAFKKIDEKLEEHVHELAYRADSSLSINPLYNIHKRNDEYYGSVREVVRNPLRTTEFVKDTIFHFFSVCNKKNKPEGVVDAVQSY